METIINTILDLSQPSFSTLQLFTLNEKEIIDSSLYMIRYTHMKLITINEQ